MIKAEGGVRAPNHKSYRRWQYQNPDLSVTGFKKCVHGPNCAAIRVKGVISIVRSCVRDSAIIRAYEAAFEIEPLTNQVFPLGTSESNLYPQLSLSSKLSIVGDGDDLAIIS